MRCSRAVPEGKALALFVRRTRFVPRPLESFSRWNHISALAQFAVRIVLRYPTIVYISNGEFLWIGQTACAGQAGVCDKSMNSRNFVPVMLWRIATVKNQHVMIDYALLPFVIFKWRVNRSILPDVQFKLSRLSAFPKPLLGEDLTHMLWTHPYNGIRKGCHAKP
jgi:hypothetical protein